MAPPAAVLPSTKICHILYTLRFIQQPAVTVTAFVASYLAYWHYALIDPIPVPFTVLLIACALVFVQYHIFALNPLHQTYLLLLKTNAPIFALLIIGFGTLWTIPGIKGEENDYFEPFRQTQGWKLADAGVEEHHKTLVRVLIVAGAVTILCSAGVLGIALYGVWRQRRMSGYVVLGLDGEEENREVGDMVDEDTDADEIPLKML